jgi:hypothetical protein
MKIIRILAAGALTLLCNVALAQSPNQIPISSGTNVDRPAAGSRMDAPTRRQPAAAAAAAAAQPAASDKKAISASCSQQADAKGLHGKARRTFREKCKRGH